MLSVVLFVIGYIISSILGILVLCNLTSLKISYRAILTVLLSSFFFGVVCSLFNVEPIATALFVIFMLAFAYYKIKNLLNCLLLCTISLILILLPLCKIICSYTFATNNANSPNVTANAPIDKMISNPVICPFKIAPGNANGDEIGR